MKIRTFIFVYYVVMGALGLAGCGAGIIPLGGGVGTPTLAGNPGDESAILTWTEVPEADEYVLNRDGSEIQRVPDLTYQDTGLTNGQEYRYTVNAVASGAQGNASNEVTLVPVGTPVPTAAARSLAVTVSWNAVGGAASYNLYWQSVPVSASPSVSKSNGDGFQLLATVDDTGAPTLTFDHTGLSNCEDQLYLVRAVNDLDQEGVDSQEALGQPATEGVLDDTFGTAGIIFESTIGGIFNDVAVLSDGRVAATFTSGGVSGALFIYSADGVFERQVDLTVVSIDIPSVRALAVDSDDNIFVSGSGLPLPSDMRVCKLTPEGNLVTSFGQVANPGCYRDGTSGTVGNDLVIDDSGGLIVAGEDETGDDKLTVWRLTFAGSLDWVYQYSVPLITTVAYGVATQGGHIVAAGVDDTLLPELFVVALDADGTFRGATSDAGAGGWVFGYGVSASQDGTFVITGSNELLSGATELPLWRYDADLNLVGRVAHRFSTGPTSTTVGADVHVDCRDNPVAAGWDSPLALLSLIALRADTSLALDTTFGNMAPPDGWFLFSSGNEDEAFAVAEDERGLLYIAGDFEDGGGVKRPALMRLK
jgi:hypothetical protein